MSETFKRILTLVQNGDVHVSEHGYDEMVADVLGVREIIAGLSAGIVIEDYPKYGKGPCVLILQRDREGNLIHVVWGIPKGKNSPAVLVTAYRPDPGRWSNDFRRRKI